MEKKQDALTWLSLVWLIYFPLSSFLLLSVSLKVTHTNDKHGFVLTWKQNLIYG